MSDNMVLPGKAQHTKCDMRQKEWFESGFPGSDGRGMGRGMARKACWMHSHV